jgi:hypothetical protein
MDTSGGPFPAPRSTADVGQSGRTSSHESAFVQVTAVRSSVAISQPGDGEFLGWYHNMRRPKVGVTYRNRTIKAIFREAGDDERQAICDRARMIENLRASKPTHLLDQELDEPDAFACRLVMRS